MEPKKAIAKAAGDIEALRGEYLRMSGLLLRLGLSDYEARAFLALVALGPSSANLVAEVAQIPRTSAYKVAKGLERKGFVRSKQGRPKTFSPVDPMELSKSLTSEIDAAFRKLAALIEVLSSRGVPQLVYTIMGRDRVLDKIGEMLSKSESSFVISSPSISVVRKRLSKEFSSAVSRKVDVTIITSPFVKTPPDVRVIRRKALIATDVISDGRTALIAAPDLSACGYTDNEALSKHLEDFLRIMAESRE